MADTEDLKSSGPKGRAGSNPALGIGDIKPCGAGTQVGVFSFLSRRARAQLTAIPRDPKPANSRTRRGGLIVGAKQGGPTSFSVPVGTGGLKHRRFRTISEDFDLVGPPFAYLS